MPVRLLSSSVLKWPDDRTVGLAIRQWSVRLVRRRPDVVRIGYFGSYARGDWGVGSDLDVVIVIERSDKPFFQRALEWDVSGLPVPAEVLVYTEAEWVSMRGRFAHTLRQEAIWVYSRAKDAGPAPTSLPPELFPAEGPKD